MTYKRLVYSTSLLASWVFPHKLVVETRSSSIWWHSLNARDWFHNGREPVSIPLSFISRNQTNLPVRTNVPFANRSVRASFTSWFFMSTQNKLEQSTPTLVRAPETSMGGPANWDLRSDATMEPQKVSSSSEMWILSQTLYHGTENLPYVVSFGAASL